MQKKTKSERKAKPEKKMQHFYLKITFWELTFFLQKCLSHNRNGHGIFVLCLFSFDINLFLD